MRNFNTGATRDTIEGKMQLSGYIHPLVLKAYGDYMLKHQKQADGKFREADNWQKGMAKDVYLDSLIRHVLDVWLEHKGYPSRDGLREALCACLFNVMGYLYEDLMEDEGHRAACGSGLRGPTKNAPASEPEPEREPATGLYQSRLPFMNARPVMHLDEKALQALLAGF